MNRPTLVTLAILGIAAAGIAFAPPAKAFDVPFDWSCNPQGTSCRAPGLNLPTKEWDRKFHKKYGYPAEIVVEHQADYDAVNSGWTKGGDCMARLADKTYPEVSLAKAKYCKFWQVGVRAPKPKITKGW